MWEAGRDSVLVALRNGRPLTFCYPVYLQVSDAWQKERGHAFVAQADCTRADMIKHLEAMT